MNNKLITLAITLTLGVILAGSVLAPIISDAEHSMSTETYTNAPNVRVVLDEVDGDDDYLIEYDGSKYTLNGENIYTCNIYTDKGWIFVGTNSISGDFVAGDITDTHVTALDVASANKIHLTATDLTITNSSDEETTTTITWGYISDSNGTWGVIRGSSVYAESVDVLKYERTFYGYLAIMEGDEGYYKNQTFTDFLEVTDLEHGGVSVAMPLVISSEWTSQDVIAPISFEVQVPNNYSGLLPAILVIVIVSLVVAAVSAVAIRKD